MSMFPVASVSTSGWACGASRTTIEDISALTLDSRLFSPPPLKNLRGIRSYPSQLSARRVDVVTFFPS